MFLPIKGKKQRKLSKDTGFDSAPVPIDILVDTIIGFLEHSTAYLRAVTNEVFSLLSKSVEETTVDLILRVNLLVLSMNFSPTHHHRP